MSAMLPVATRRARTSVLGPWAFPALAASAFLPYVAKGVGLRVENALGAGLAVLALATLSVRGRLARAFVPPLLLSTALFGLVVVATVAWQNDPQYLKVGIGRFDHYFRPVSILLVAAVAFHGTDRAARERTLVHTIRALLIGTTFNTLLQIAMALGANVDWLLNPFRPGSSVYLDVSVAELSADNNRFTGVFNQPIEQGLVYALALLACVYAWRNGGLSRLELLLGAGLVFVGGVLGISKVFLLGGVPVAVALAVAQGGIRPRHILGAIAAIAVTALGGWLVFSRWSGGEQTLDLLKMLVDPERAMYAITGGRVSGAPISEELIISQMLIAFRQSPLFGVGTASGILLQDNEYVMTLAECGLAGIGLLLARLVAMTTPLIRASRRDPVTPLFVALILVTVGGAFGGPITGIPRSGTVLWTLYAVAGAVLAAERKPGRSPVSAEEPQPRFAAP